MPRGTKVSGLFELLFFGTLAVILNRNLEVLVVMFKRDINLITLSIFDTVIDCLLDNPINVSLYIFLQPVDEAGLVFERYFCRSQ